MPHLLAFLGKDADYFVSTADIIHDFHTNIHGRELTHEMLEESFDGYNLVSTDIRSAADLSDKFNDQLGKYFAATYLWSRSISLKMEHELTHNFSYDIVVLLRPDIMIKDDIPLNLHEADISREWFASGDKPFHYMLNEYVTTNDLLVIGTNWTMNLIGNACAGILQNKGYHMSHYASEDCLQVYLSMRNMIPIDSVNHRKYLGRPIIPRAMVHSNGGRSIHIHE